MTSLVDHKDVYGNHWKSPESVETKKRRESNVNVQTIVLVFYLFSDVEKFLNLITKTLIFPHCMFRKQFSILLSSEMHLNITTLIHSIE